MLQPMEEMILPPKRQAVVDRLRRRIETYRRRQTECVPRFDQSFSGACEQQNLETSALQKRFLEGKAKRQAKKTERKPDLPAISGNLHSSVHVQQKFGGSCDYEPPSKLHCGGPGGPGEALTKFSVEIVQQLEFTTSTADSQPQQISTNVTVKALANAVKTSASPPPRAPPAPSPPDCEREYKAECKSEAADDEFVGLDECAAALDRDAADFSGLADLIGEDDGDEITSIEQLLTQISEYPEFSLKDFEFDTKMNGEPVEGSPAPRPYGAGGEMSPAAQTLKHMAEQHQQASGADWARYRQYAGYRPRAPPPAAPDLHLSQHQQMHLSQHPNLQVSAAQHMQVSGSAPGHVSVAAQQGMYASFNHQGTPPPQHHQGGGCESYSVSQSQSINFQQMRARPAAPPGPAPGQQPLGVAAAGISREHQAKMLQQQQQQMLRAQQQMRPPPPEYKARFAGGAAGAGARRPPRPFAPQHRAYPPDWRVMMQQQARHQFPTHHHQAGGFMGSMGGVSQQMQLHQARLQQQQMMQQNQQRSQGQQQSTMSHLLMQQNQMINVQGQAQVPNIHMSQSQSMSMQQSMGGMPHQGSPMQNQSPMGQNQSPMGQNQSPMGQNQNPMGQSQNPMGQSQNPMGQSQNPMGQSQNPMGQGQHMPQAGGMHAQMQQSAMMQNGLGHGHGSHGNHHAFSALHNASSFSGQGADFNLDFLDNMPSTDASNLTAQELLNSLDNSFLNDIL